MKLSVKNWSKFQHFKDRKPIWIKLYREILDDLEFHALDPVSAKLLVLLWLLASENEGELPPLDVISFRLRVSVPHIVSCIPSLEHWLICDDIALISGVYQEITVADIEVPRREEKRREEKEKNMVGEGFASFWEPYPRKVAKAEALKAFKKQHINGELPLILADIEKRKTSEDWLKSNGQFIPHPATYLNQRRWEDESTTSQPDPFAGGF
jgi:hypothetical protein